MAVLNDWKKLTRVLPGKPFGDGVDGDYSSTTIPTMTYRSCSGSASSTTLTLTSAGFSNGDLILIHQTRGTGAGQWEINKIVSGGGTTSLTLQKSLQYTYTDSGASQAQVIKIPRYRNVTVPSGATWTGSSWNGDVGGILVLAANGTITVTGTITGMGQGFRYGLGVQSNDNTGYEGEGYNTLTQDKTTSGVEGGGGGGYNASAGGGSYGNTSGGSGGYNDSVPSNGSTGGVADLTSIYFGGGGGGACRIDAPPANMRGGGGGGIVILIAKTISTSGGINNNGQNGVASNVNNWCRAGGGGAGGGCLLVCQNSTLGTNLITASYGIGGQKTSGGNSGANGGVGRISIHHSGTVTGTTNPSFYDQYDPTLVESLGGSFIFNLI